MAIQHLPMSRQRFAIRIKDPDPLKRTVEQGSVEELKSGQGQIRNQNRMLPR